MALHTEQIPRQDLPDGGSAVPSEVQPTEAGGQLVTQGNPMPTRAARKGKVAVDHSATINFAVDAAVEVVNDSQLDELDWLVVLKSKLQACDTPFRDGDLTRYLRQAKLNRDGRKDFIRSNQKLEKRTDEWLWHGVIMREATNIVFALPKVGKTRLMLAMLSELIKGRGEFAGLKMTSKRDELLILGPDQSEASWASYLDAVGLLTGRNQLEKGVVALTSAATAFCLDEYWLSRVEEILRAHGPLVVLLDSYSAAIRPLGLDENKTEAATPLMKLHNLVHQYKSTLIVIHHANKSGGEGNTARASRGSSAITAAADNLVEMRKFRADDEEGIKKYELHVEGRAEAEATPLIGFSKHSNEWMSCGSVREHREEQMKDEQYDALTKPQLVVLDALVRASVEDKKGLAVGELADLIHGEATKPQKVYVSKTIKRLVDLGLVYQGGSAGEGSRYKQNLFMATGWAVAKHQIDF